MARGNVHVPTLSEQGHALLLRSIQFEPLPSPFRQATPHSTFLFSPRSSEDDNPFAATVLLAELPTPPRRRWLMYCSRVVASRFSDAQFCKGGGRWNANRTKRRCEGIRICVFPSVPPANSYAPPFERFLALILQQHAQKSREMGWGRV